MADRLYQEKDAVLVSIVEELQKTKNKEIKFRQSKDEEGKITLIFEISTNPIRYLSFHIPDWK
jgi:hypothetical protein